ncbi:hypothetical protein [Actinomadura sp. DC4]|uniref:hypothetical protein n=1 Tax=Actinomadura sp. DC4 TaxID=3055069 RepID=UPI0025B0F84F|nr:hypothetical protein [Actinomadura sp. DC4]MDN3359198.1 hypothetical protein [Actinomadura sp. DC4]
MRRVMTYVMVWSGATTLAVLLVWFGARPVLHNAVFGDPPAQPVVGGRPSVSPPAETSAPPNVDSSTVATPSTPSKSPSAKASPSTLDHTYVVRGGKVVLAITDTSAQLVSAVPNPGYAVQTWHGDQWLRVDFANADRTSSVIAAWNGHAPTVQSTE